MMMLVILISHNIEEYNRVILTFKSLHNKSPEYIFNLITVYEIPYNLRSLVHDNLLLLEPKTRLVMCITKW